LACASGLTAVKGEGRWYHIVRVGLPEERLPELSAVVAALAGGYSDAIPRSFGLPPEKWCSLRYGFEPCGGLLDVEEEAQA
jgi:hypothetical protein